MSKGILANHLSQKKLVHWNHSYLKYALDTNLLDYILPSDPLYRSSPVASFAEVLKRMRKGEAYDCFGSRSFLFLTFLFSTVFV